MSDFARIEAALGGGGGRVARRFVVSGRVTGVGFRYFTQDAARREGLAGVVRNLPDGRVEAIAEGDEASVTRLEIAVRRGPSRARVDRVEIDDLPVTGRYVGFTVDG
jgi:acylphosphatase